ncbi:rolling circle replication-associated protein [Alicyclobacillus ferrooxydans]|uniref:rolling circle replication-associated protein n=1 Tax=Alicyclobacillus ferrooxydans TaxID=471514 RepID=UPI0006D5623D|nr:hypothetical protein [Alicyclobacillus ferrooxydans]
MAGHDCIITILGDGRVIVKQFEKATKSNPYRRLNYVQETEETTPIEKAIVREIVRNKHCDDRIGDRQRARDLYPREIERFCNLVDCNFSVGHLYLTLTYERQYVALSEAGTQFENWIKRMRDKYESQFRYIAVRSFQERGTLHFHMLADLPRIPRIQLLDGTFRDIWGHGNVHARKIYKLPMGYNQGRLKRYLIKNLREFKRDDRSFNKRLYLTSNNIVNPLVIRCRAEEFEELKLSAVGEVTALSKGDYRTKFLGKVAVTPYKISSDFHNALLDHFNF